ncbi:MAG: glycoside hydrolase family 31 protein [Bacteroidota bacterium]|nr:glycoside hydrolase family 31 protein [Bacteroidota bacterium]
MLRKKRFRRLFTFLGWSAGLLLLLFYIYIVLPVWGIPFNGQRHGNPPLTPAWALECWLWEDDENTARRVDELLEGYAEHDIPVRTILLDSPWSLRYNDFQVDEDLYPEAEAWFNNLQDSGYRVVLWMTPNVNSYSKGTAIEDSEAWYNEARDQNYLAGSGQQINWWKGDGGFIDYTNPEALDWWHGLQQKVFDYGIDGWKLDGSATLFSSRIGPVPIPYMRTYKGITTTRQYMDLYYRQEYLHGLKQNPEFITLSRSIDRNFHPEGFAPIDASPVNWVGDQEHHWTVSSTSEDGQKQDIALKGIEGFESAIESILQSASLGYSIVGSDVAGFSGGEIPPRLYIRWAQFSTFCGLFLNGGHGERALWKRSEQELEIIREYSWLHTEMVPYIYSSVVEAHRGGEVLQRSIRGKYHYMFGNELLIAPIYKDELKNSVRLPRGKWRYWFDDQEIIEGPLTIERDFPLEEYPVYIKEGAIIPMHIERSYTGIGDENSRGYLTLRIFPDGNNRFEVHHPDSGTSTTIIVDETEESITVHLEGVKKAHILYVQLSSAPKSIILDNKQLSSPQDYLFDAERSKLIIRTDAYSLGEYTIIK